MANRKNTGTAKSPGKVTRESTKKKRTQETAASERAPSVSWADLLCEDDVQVQPPQAEKLSPPAPVTVVPRSEQSGVNIVWNANNQVIEVTSARGHTTRIDYDPDTRKPGKITDGSTGICYVWNGRLWVESDPPVGNLPKIITSIDVAQSGDITFELSGFRKIMHANGSITVIRRDGASATTDVSGASLNRDANQRLYQIIYPDGTTTRIEYNEQGGIKALKKDNGSALAVEGTTAVTSQGKVVLLSANDIGEIKRLDGSMVEISPTDVKEAARLRQITDPIDSDEEGVFAVLNGWTGAQLERIDAVYWARYGTGLVQELSDELSEEALEQARLLLKGKGFS